MRAVLVNKTVTYFNFFVGYFKQWDMSVMTKVPNFTNFDLLHTVRSSWLVHDQVFQGKLSRRRLPITFVFFVSHAGAQALRPITFT